MSTTSATTVAAAASPPAEEKQDARLSQYRTHQPEPTKAYPEKKLSDWKIAFVPGTGSMGSGLARNHAKLGNSVIIGSRDLAKANATVEQIKTEIGSSTASTPLKLSGATNEDAARDADIIYWCVTGPLEDRNKLLKSLAPHLAGKIIVDITNVVYLPEFDDSKWGQTSSTELNIATLAPVTARWVCGYKATSASFLSKPVSENGPHQILIAGDDVNANRVIRELADAQGFKGTDGGNLKNTRIIELMGPMFMVDVMNRNGGKAAGWRWSA